MYTTHIKKEANVKETDVEKERERARQQLKQKKNTSRLVRFVGTIFIIFFFLFSTLNVCFEFNGMYTEAKKNAAHIYQMKTKRYKAKKKI